MTGPILVAYASRYGSTREVAESVAATLRERELRVEVLPAGEVRTLDPYSGVVLGGGIYIGRWHRDARGFVRHFRHELESMPVAVFGMGPVDDSVKGRAGSEKQLERTLEKLPIEPFSAQVFGGAVDPAKLRFPFNHMAAADIRNWDEIRDWALLVAERFEHVPALA
jgi:menaquinone-dependent protoporphyrinogen oxidase